MSYWERQHRRVVPLGDENVDDGHTPLFAQMFSPLPKSPTASFLSVLVEIVTILHGISGSMVLHMKKIIDAF